MWSVRWGARLAWIEASFSMQVSCGWAYFTLVVRHCKQTDPSAAVFCLISLFAFSTDYHVTYFLSFLLVQVLRA